MTPIFIKILISSPDFTAIWLANSATVTGPEIFTSRMIGAAGFSNLCEDNSSAAFPGFRLPRNLGPRSSSTDTIFPRLSSRFPAGLLERRGSSSSLGRSRRICGSFLWRRPSSSFGGGGGSRITGSTTSPMISLAAGVISEALELASVAFSNSPT